MTSKEKINNVLGIASGESIDDFLDSLSIDKTNEISQAVNAIDNSVKQNLINIDNSLSTLQENSVLAPTILVDINSSMHEVEELIQLSKKMFKHIYESIITTELVDSELVGSVSKLLEAIHINISEFISLYRDKQKYVERIKIMTFQQEQRKELMQLKHNLDMQKIQQQNDSNAIDAEGKMTYSVEALTKMLNDIEMNK